MDMDDRLCESVVSGGSLFALQWRNLDFGGTEYGTEYRVRYYDLFVDKLSVLNSNRC